LNAVLDLRTEQRPSPFAGPSRRAAKARPSQSMMCGGSPSHPTSRQKATCATSIPGSPPEGPMQSGAGHQNARRRRRCFQHFWIRSPKWSGNCHKRLAACAKPENPDLNVECRWRPKAGGRDAKTCKQDPTVAGWQQEFLGQLRSTQRKSSLDPRLNQMLRFESTLNGRPFQNATTVRTEMRQLRSRASHEA
jgi:hypothetical protein